MEVLKNDSYSQDDIYYKLLDFSQTRCENNEVFKQENDGVIKNNLSLSNEEEDLFNTTNPVNKTIESDDDDNRTKSKNDDDITKRKDADDDLIERKDDDNENDTPDSEDVDDSTKRIYFSTTEQSLEIIRKGVNILHKMDDLLSIDYWFFISLAVLVQKMKIFGEA